MEKCWICGNIANSGEHKFKASDIKRTYGKKFNGYYVNEEAQEINSYKAKELKFPKIICEECNSRLTRPHDDAYDIFVDYFLSNYEKLNRDKIIDFEAIYGQNWKHEKLNLYRYYAKHVGCKITTSDFKNELSDLSNFIKGKKTLNNLVLKFELKEVIKSIHEFYNKKHKYAHLFNGPTIYFGEKQNLNFGGWLSNNWLTTNWAFSKNINLKKRTNFNSKFENLEVIDLEYYDNNLAEFKTYDKMIIYFDYGKLDTLEKRLVHFKDMIG